MTQPEDTVWIAFHFRGAVGCASLDEEVTSHWVEKQPVPDEYYVESFSLEPIPSDD